MKKMIVVMMMVLVAVGQTTGGIIVIDFESLDDQGLGSNTYFGSSYSEDGFELTTTEEFAYTTLYVFDPPPTTFTVVLYSGPENGTVTIEKEDNGSFDLVSIEFVSGLSQTVTMLGTKTDGSTVSQAILLGDDTWSIDSYLLNGFTDIVSANWENNTTFGFDNITVIPEPATLLLFAFGTVLVRKQCYLKPKS